MMRWFGICCLIFVVVIWATVAMSLWLAVGPWRLVRFLACRIGRHERIYFSVNPVNQNTEMRCVRCRRFVPWGRHARVN